MQNTPETPSGKPIPEAMDAQPVPAENPMIKKRWFGRGIYGSKDVPIRVLDACIGVIADHCRQRTEVVPSNVGYGIAVETAYPMEVTVGGATVFVTNVERFEKL